MCVWVFGCVYVFGCDACICLCCVYTLSYSCVCVCVLVGAHVFVELVCMPTYADVCLSEVLKCPNAYVRVHFPVSVCVWYSMYA